MKNALAVTLIFLVISTSFSLACTCEGLDKESAKAMFKEADYVVIGKAVTNIDSDPYFVNQMNLQKEGADVLFQVDSVLKGDILKDEEIFIYQHAGSCTRTFKLGESYLIFGQRIKEVRQAASYNIKAKKGELPPPPPPPNFEDMKLEIHADKKFIRFLNNQIKRHKTASVSLCSTFYVESDYYPKIKEYLIKD